MNHSMCENYQIFMKMRKQFLAASHESRAQSTQASSSFERSSYERDFHSFNHASPLIKYPRSKPLSSNAPCIANEGKRSPF